MDTKVQTMLEKAKVFADKTGRAAVRVADTAGKKAAEVAQATRVNLQIFDLNTENEVLYKEIGKLIYDVHCGGETQENDMEEKLTQLDENMEQISVLRKKLAETKATHNCPNCSKACAKDCSFCPHCGAQL